MLGGVNVKGGSEKVVVDLEGRWVKRRERIGYVG